MEMEKDNFIKIPNDIEIIYRQDLPFLIEDIEWIYDKNSFTLEDLVDENPNQIYIEDNEVYVSKELIEKLSQDKNYIFVKFDYLNNNHKYFNDFNLNKELKITNEYLVELTKSLIEEEFDRLADISEDLIIYLLEHNSNIKDSLDFLLANIQLENFTKTWIEIIRPTLANKLKITETEINIIYKKEVDLNKFRKVTNKKKEKHWDRVNNSVEEYIKDNIDEIITYLLQNYKKLNFDEVSKIIKNNLLNLNKQNIILKQEDLPYDFPAYIEEILDNNNQNALSNNIEELVRVIIDKILVNNLKFHKETIAEKLKKLGFNKVDTYLGIEIYEDKNDNKIFLKNGEFYDDDCDLKKYKQLQKANIVINKSTIKTIKENLDFYISQFQNENDLNDIGRQV